MSDSVGNVVVLMSEGGDLQPEPHAWVVRIYEDGTVETRTGTRTAGSQVVGALLARIEDTGFFRTDTQALARELKDSGGQLKIIEGGHGRVTLAVTRHGRTHSVSMSHPDAYAGSDLPQVRSFRDAIEMVRAFAAATPQ